MVRTTQQPSYSNRATFIPSPTPHLPPYVTDVQTERKVGVANCNFFMQECPDGFTARIDALSIAPSSGLSIKQATPNNPSTPKVYVFDASTNKWHNNVDSELVFSNTGFHCAMVLFAVSSFDHLQIGDVEKQPFPHVIHGSIHESVFWSHTNHMGTTSKIALLIMDKRSHSKQTKYPGSAAFLAPSTGKYNYYPPEKLHTFTNYDNSQHMEVALVNISYMLLPLAEPVLYPQ